MMRSTYRRRVAAVLALALVGVLTAASPGHAAIDLPVPPDEPCTAATVGTYAYTVDAAEVSPTITHFLSINIAPGTTGERTETLQRVRTVTTTVNFSTEITVSFSILLVKVSAKVGYSVQTTTSTTDSESTSMRWNFNDPGYYGLYKGTRAVAGHFSPWYCQQPPTLPGHSPLEPRWVRDTLRPNLQYTTYANMELGTVTCGESVPAGSLREQARLQLGC